MTRPTTAEATRREGVPAVEVELADGLRWGFALPEPRLYPVVLREVDPFGRPTVRVESAARAGYPLRVGRLRDGVLAACRGRPATEQRDAFLRLATGLLRLAHDLDEPGASALLDPARVDLARVARELIPAAFGGPADLSRSGGR